MKKTSVQKTKQSFDLFASKYSVMTLFFKWPRVDFTLSEIARNTGLSKATVSKVIKDLKNKKFINVIDLGVIYRIRANTDSDYYKKEKIAFNLGAIIRSDIVTALAEKYNNPRCIILFGSFRKGEDDAKSDIDVAVEVPDESETHAHEDNSFIQFEKEMERAVVVHTFNRRKVDSNLFANIANGLVLYGFLEVSK